jgi:hypothetical protein
MVAVNILIYSNMLSKIHSLKHVVWIGSHVDILHYMQMSEVSNLLYNVFQFGFNLLSKGKSSLIFPRYHSFLGSLGLLLSNMQGMNV